MTLLEEFRETARMLDSAGITTRTQLRQALNRAGCFDNGHHEVLPTGNGEGRTPMRKLQGELTHWVSRVHREQRPVMKDGQEARTMGETRFWIEQQADVWGFERRSYEEKYREDCERMIKWCEGYLK